jgi:hypothetical protein
MWPIIARVVFLSLTMCGTSISADKFVQYPPNGYYLVKGESQQDGRFKNRLTYQVTEVLCGPANLKGRFFIAIFADVSREDERTFFLANYSKKRWHEETYHWVVAGASEDGSPLKKDVLRGGIQLEERTAETPQPKFKPISLRHLSLTGIVHYSNPQVELRLEKVLPMPRKFPMVGELEPHHQEHVDRRRAAGKDPYAQEYGEQPMYIIPPPKKETEEWMAALKEFCNTKDGDAREKLLKKYIESKNSALAEWAQFVVRKYGWKPTAPDYEEKK